MVRLLVIVALLGASASVSLMRAAEAGKPSVLFNGKDLTGWKIKGAETKNKWRVGQVALDENNPAKLTVTPQAEGGILINESAGVNLYTEEKFGDGTLEV